MNRVLDESVATTEIVKPQSLPPESRMMLNQIGQATHELVSKVIGIPNLVPIEGLDNALKGRVADYGKRRSQLIQQTKELFGPLLAALERVHHAQGTVGDVSATALSCRDEKTITLEHALSLSVEAESLAADIATQQKPLAEEAERERDETLETVKEELTAMGQGIKSTDAGASGNNGDLAERQFTFMARQNLRFRAAYQKAEEAKNRVTQHNTIKYQAAKHAEELRKRITNEALSQVRV